MAHWRWKKLKLSMPDFLPLLYMKLSYINYRAVQSNLTEHD
jgi:hypothetical protein